MLDALVMLRKSWDKISKETIANCFTHSGLSVRQPHIQDDESNDLDSFLPLVTSEPVSSDDFVHIDDEVTTAEVLTDEEIVALTQNEDSGGDDDDDDDEEDTPSAPCPTVAEARAALDVLQTFCLTHEKDVGISSLRGLEGHIERIFHTDILSKAKQTTLPTIWASNNNV